MEPILNPGQAAQLDQMIAETGAALDDVITMYRKSVAQTGNPEMSTVGLTAHLLGLAEEEGERGLEWIAQLLAVATFRLGQARLSPPDRIGRQP